MTLTQAPQFKKSFFLEWFERFFTLFSARHFDQFGLAGNLEAEMSEELGHFFFRLGVAFI